MPSRPPRRQRRRKRGQTPDGRPERTSRRVEPADDCRTPDKRHFPTADDALGSIVETSPHRAELHPYRCRCGAGFCLTSQPT